MRIKLRKKALDKAYKIVAKAIECWANFYFKLRTSLKAGKKKKKKKLDRYFGKMHVCT